jgi:acetyltransferase-like isoleucine patch superfamily enzyme
VIQPDLTGTALPPNPYNPLAWLVGDPEVGDGCWIGAFTLIDGSGGLSIGNGCDISSGAQIYSHSTVRRVISERLLDTERAPTRVGPHVHVGAGAIVMMGCDIGHHSVVGAGAVVPQHTVAPPWSLIVGVPARIIEDGARRFRTAGSV